MLRWTIWLAVLLLALIGTAARRKHPRPVVPTPGLSSLRPRLATSPQGCLPSNPQEGRCGSSRDSESLEREGLGPKDHFAPMPSLPLKPRFEQPDQC